MVHDALVSFQGVLLVRTVSVVSNSIKSRAIGTPPLVSFSIFIHRVKTNFVKLIFEIIILLKTVNIYIIHFS